MWAAYLGWILLLGGGFGMGLLGVELLMGAALLSPEAPWLVAAGLAACAIVWGAGVGLLWLASREMDRRGEWC